MKFLRRQIQAAPLFLPLVAVVGSILGQWWLMVPVLAVLLCLVSRLWRIGLCVLLCALVSGLHTQLVQQRMTAFCEKAEWEEVVELTGTVERTLKRGCVLNTGWSGVRVVLRGECPYTPGDELRVQAAWQESAPEPVRGVFSPQAWLRGMGAAASLHIVTAEKLGKPFSLHTLRYWGLRMRDTLAARLMPAGSEDEPSRQVLCALVLGDKSGAEPETMSVFRDGGCLHAFAVSGLHVGLVSGILWVLFRLLRVRPVVVRPLLLVAVGVYVLVTGCAVPALRAYLMLAVLLGGYILRRRVNLLNTWSFAALLILLAEPFQLYNAGFLLSFGVYAVLCMALWLCLEEKAWFGPDDYIPVTLLTPWEMRYRRFELGLRGAVIVSLSAWLIAVPITLLCFHSANTSSFLTNLAITPLLPVVMCCGLLHVCVAGVPWVGAVTGWAAQQSAVLLLAVVGWFGELPYAYLPAQEPAPLHSLLVQGTGYGGSFSMLGNHGLLVDCGNMTTAELKTVPTLFHAGYTPAVLLVTSPRVSSGGGAEVLQRQWPELQIIHAHELPAEGCSFETQAGRFTLYPPPADFPRRHALNHSPVVLWESGAERVLYVGNAPYGAYAALPEEVRDVDVVILGRHPKMPVPVSGFGRLVLLPGAVHEGPLPAHVLPVAPQGTLWLDSLRNQSL